MRLQASDVGLHLSSHALLLRDNTHPVTLDASCTPPKLFAAPEGEAAPFVIPYEHFSCEADVLRVLARGTRAFEALADPHMRNA